MKSPTAKAFSAAAAFAGTISFVFLGSPAAASDILAKAIENAAVHGWLPLVPPSAEVRLGTPALVKSRGVALLCDAGGAEPAPQRTLYDVKLEFALLRGEPLDVVFGKLLAQLLVDSGLIAKVAAVSRIDSTVERIEQREVSAVDLRRLEQRWSPECRSAVKRAWQSSNRPFSVMGVSQWWNTKLQAYDSAGAPLALAAKPLHGGPRDREALALADDRRSVTLPGVMTVAVRPWPLRQRIFDLAGETTVVEVDSQPFAQQEVDAMYLLLLPGPPP